MAQPLTGKIFISHNREDKPWVRRFVKLLRKQGVQVFFDEEDIAFGETIADGVMRGIADTRKLILFLSPASLSSRWVAAEYLAALYENLRGKDIIIIPVILEPVNRDDIPLFIRGLSKVDLTDHPRRNTVFKRFLRSLGVTAKKLPEIPTDDPYNESDDDPDDDFEEHGVVLEPVATFHVAQVASESRRHIAIIGMGYIGSSLAVALAAAGHQVVGMERDLFKFNTLSNGESHLLEPGIDDLLRQAHSAKNLTVEQGFTPELADTVEIAVICIGPTKGTGEDSWDTSRFEGVVKEIAAAIGQRTASAPLNIIIAATVRPQDYVLAESVLAESLTEITSPGYALAISPLFLREGSMLADIQSPPFIITGTFDGNTNSASSAWSDALLGLVSPSLPDAQACRVRCMTVSEASVVKLASNTYHAMKVCFANEVGRICRGSGIDAHAVMEAFNQDKILNISPLYLRPGFAFGGSCLGKDIQGLLSLADPKGKDTYQLIEALQSSNISHLNQAARLITKQVDASGQKRVGFFGVTFKPGTDDMRGSPAIELMNLLPRAYEIYAIDSDLDNTPNLTGRNLAQWRTVLNRHNIMMAGTTSALALNCQILVITKMDAVQLKELRSLVSDQHCIIDLIGEADTLRDFACSIHHLV